jgi:predicted nucleic acid-binding protein
MVAAIRSDAGASRRLLVAGIQQRIKMLISVPLLIEYEAVMCRPEHLKASRLSEADVAVVLDAVAASAEAIRLSFLWRPFARDPDDDMVVETAVNGSAEGIVTFNRRDFASVPSAFGVPILSPAAAVQLMEKMR